MITGLIWPTMSDYIDGESETWSNYTNPDKMNTYTLYDSGLGAVNWNIEYTYNAATATVNGSEMLVKPTETYVFLLVTDRLAIFAETAGFSMYGYHIGSDDQNGYLFKDSTDSSSISISIVSGVVTVTYGSTEYTCTPSSFISVIDNVSGDNIRITSSAVNDYRINNPGQIYGATVINTNDLGFGYFIANHGTIADMSYDMDFTGVKSDEYGNVYVISGTNYAYPVEAGTNANGTPFIPFNFFIPIEIVMYESSSGLNVSMLMVLGLMVVLLLLVTVARNLNMRG